MRKRKINQVITNLLGANIFVKDKPKVREAMGISQPRVNQVVKNLLGANIFLKDKCRVREAIRLYLSGMSQVKVVRK